MLEPEQLFSSGTVCIAAGNSSQQEGLHCKEGDLLTVVSCNDKGNTCVVTGPDGTQGEVPTSLVRVRPPIPLHPLPYLHKDATLETADNSVIKEGEFMVMPHNNGGYCICVRSKGIVKLHFVAMDTNNQLTIDGIECFNSLPDLIKFYSDVDEGVGSTGVVPLLEHPVHSQTELVQFVDPQALAKHWGLSGDCISKNKLIGKGEFGEVFAGMYRDHYEVAMKLPAATNSEDLMKEAAIMTHLRHKNLVQLVGVVFNGAELQMMAMELMSRGSLGKYLITRGRSIVSQKEQLQYARDVCAGMVYISSQGFIHRDLAIRNCLLSSSGVAKISDFGLSTKACVHIPKETGKFPVKWTAPEALKERLFSEKSDVWSFGILLWEIYAFGRAPYPGVYADELLEQLEEGYNMDLPEGCPEGIYDIMTECWCYQPQGRPSFTVVMTMLARSFGESRTPCSSPQLMRHGFAKKKQQAEQLLSSPVVNEVYHQMTSCDITSDIITGNVIVTGPRGSGKTSLIRGIQGAGFRQAEPSSAHIMFSNGMCEVTDHQPWRGVSGHAVSYDNELARCMARELINRTPVVGVASAPPLPSPLHHSPPPLPSPFHLSPPSLPSPLHLSLPPLPLINRRRSASFTYHGPSHTRGQLPRNSHMSMLVEDIAPAHGPALSFTGSHPDGLNHTPPPSPRKRSLRRKISFNIFRKVSIKKRNHTPSKKKHVSNSALSLPTTPTEHKQSPFFPSHSPQSVATETPPSSPPTFISALPPGLEGRIRDKLSDCVTGELPAEVYLRLVDMPGHLTDTFPSSSLLTPSSVVLAVLDCSKQDGGAHVAELVAHTNALFCGSVGGKIKPLVVLVGSQVDKTSLSLAKDNMDMAYTALKGSGCGQYLAASHFIVSAAAATEQSSLDSLKTYIVNHVKASYLTKVPLKWLKVLGKLKSNHSSGRYIVPLKEVKETLSVSDNEWAGLISFLVSNQLVMTYPGVPALRDIAIMNTQWFVDRLNELFCLSHPSASLPAHLSHDYHMLVSRGHLTQQLLDHIWSDCSKTQQKELLVILHQLEVVSLRNVDSTPISPWESQRSLSSLSSSHAPSMASLAAAISKIFVPSLILEAMPQHIIPVAAASLIPLVFKLPPSSIIPKHVLPKLLVRCLQLYNGDGMLYSNGACFTVDHSTILIIYELSIGIRVSLQPSHDQPYPLIGQNLPAADVAMTTLMFLQASFTDIIATWLDKYTEYQLCVGCTCCHGDDHYLHLSNEVYPALIDDNGFLKEAVSPMSCERGGSVSSLPLSLLPWFGKDPVVPTEVQQDNDEFVSRDDILLLQRMDISADVVNDIVSVDNDVPLLSLVSALEGIGRHDAANRLIESRMISSGIAF